MQDDAVKGDVSDVKEMYTRYNFLHQKPRRWWIRKVINFLLRRRTRLVQGPKSLGQLAIQTNLRNALRHLGVSREITTLLDAGSGTGQLCAALAGQDPNWSVTGIDLTDEHVRISRERFGSIKNLRYAQCNLMDRAQIVERAEPPAAGFDVIFSIGVLHALPSPQTGLANLKTILHKDGVLMIYLYDGYGRYTANLLRKVVFEIGGNIFHEERVRLSAALLPFAVKQTRFKQLQEEEMPAQDPAILADTFCHPIEYTYSIEDARRFGDEAGLDIIGFFDMGGFGHDPMMHQDEFIASVIEAAPTADRAWLAKKMQSLSPYEKACVVEMLADRHSFQGLLVALGHKGSYPSIYASK